MKISDELEVYFISFALKHGHAPVRRYGFERHSHIIEVAIQIRADSDVPVIANMLRTNKEVGGSNAMLLERISGVYLDWLYAQDLNPQPEPPREDKVKVYNPKRYMK